MPILLTPDTEEQLSKVAARRGTSPDALANQLLIQSLGEYSVPVPNENRANLPEDRLTPQELTASVENLRHAFADAEAGRLVDADDVFRSARKKANL